MHCSRNAFFEERDNDTLKSLKIVPVSMSTLVFSKLFVLLIVSVLYSLSAFVTTVVFSAASHMYVEHFLQKLVLCIMTGIMVWVAVLPCVAVLVALKKNYIFSVLFSFLYAIAGFMITNTTIKIPAPNIFMLLPVNVISRWLLPFFEKMNTAKYPFDIVPSSVNTFFCVTYLLIYVGIYGYIIYKYFKKWEE